MTEDIKSPKPKYFLKLAIAVIILLVALAVAAKIIYAKQDDSVKTGLNVLGLSIESWDKRAEAAAQSTINQGVADSILSITHPTGKNAILSGISSTSLGQDRMSVKITVKWKGGILGSDYLTVVE